MHLRVKLVSEATRFGRLDERRDVAMRLREGLNGVQQNGFPCPAQAKKNLRPVVTPIDDPLEGDGRLVKDHIAPRKLWGLGPGAGHEGITNWIHSRYIRSLCPYSNSPIYLDK